MADRYASPSTTASVVVVSLFTATDPPIWSSSPPPDGAVALDVTSTRFSADSSMLPGVLRYEYPSIRTLEVVLTSAPANAASKESSDSVSGETVIDTSTLAEMLMSSSASISAWSAGSIAVTSTTAPAFRCAVPTAVPFSMVDSACMATFRPYKNGESSLTAAVPPSRRMAVKLMSPETELSESEVPAFTKAVGSIDISPPDSMVMSPASTSVNPLVVILP